MAKRALRRRLALIPFQYRRWLISGKPGALIYLEPLRVEALWDQYGDAVTERHVAKYPYSRPPNWWRYSAPKRRSPQETEFQYLERLGLLYPSELARLKRRVGAN
jgi:hypothetical protein